MSIYDMKKEKYTLEREGLSEIKQAAEVYARNKDVWLQLGDSIYFFNIQGKGIQLMEYEIQSEKTKNIE